MRQRANTSRTRFVLVAVVLVGCLGGAAWFAVPREHEGAGDPDRAPGAHVGSPAGYASRNAVSAPAAVPAAGWVGESQLANEDTWEPTIAADPSSPYVYAMYNRYGPACGHSCPNPAMYLRVSADGGVSWSAERLMCSCKTQGQYDPVLTTTSSGVVYARG